MNTGVHRAIAAPEEIATNNCDQELSAIHLMLDNCTTLQSQFQEEQYHSLDGSTVQEMAAKAELSVRVG